MEDSKIQWTHHTFNPWRGCTKISPGCTNCYAEAMSRRNPEVLGIWGDQGTRVIASEAQWRLPLKWNREAKEAGQRRRVFCASLADVFEDRPELDLPLARLLKLIHRTTNLDWLLLTKRPHLFVKRMMSAMNAGYACHDPDCRGGGELAEQWHCYEVAMPNVWLGVSVEDQQRADERIPYLLQIPAKVRFLSMEPLLGEVDISQWLRTPIPCPDGLPGCQVLHARRDLHWVIVGGESGGGARSMLIEWARSLRDQCLAVGVPFFMKQLGSVPIISDNFPAPSYQRSFRSPVVVGDGRVMLKLVDKKGGDMAEWPEDLRVRQFPNP